MRTSVVIGLLLLLAGPPAGAEPCAGRDQLLELRYPDRGTLWLPAEAACGGSFPLIVLLHGANGDHREAPLVGGGLALEVLVRTLIDAHVMRPVMLAAPVQLEGATAKIYGAAFDPAHHLALITAALAPRKLQIESLSYVGHSASGCHHRNGLHKVLTELDRLIPAFAPKLLLWGTADTCYRVPYHWEVPRKTIAGKDVILVNMQSVQDDAEIAHYERTLMPHARPFACPAGLFTSCLADPVETWCSYRTHGVRHADNPTVFVREVLPRVFPVDPAVRACR